MIFPWNEHQCVILLSQNAEFHHNILVLQIQFHHICYQHNLMYVIDISHALKPRIFAINSDRVGEILDSVFQAAIFVFSPTVQYCYAVNAGTPIDRYLSL